MQCLVSAQCLSAGEGVGRAEAALRLRTVKILSALGARASPFRLLSGRLSADFLVQFYV